MSRDLDNTLDAVGPRPAANDHHGPDALDRAEIALKVTALAFMEIMQAQGLHPALYAPGLEIRLTRMDTTELHDG